MVTKAMVCGTFNMGIISTLFLKSMTIEYNFRNRLKIALVIIFIPQYICGVYKFYLYTKEVVTKHSSDYHE